MATAPAVPKKKSDTTYLWFLIGSTLVLVFIFAALGTRLKAPGFLGTRATLGAGLVLVVEISLLAAMWYGRVAIRRGRQDTHKYVLTTAAVFHLVTVSFVMFVTFRELISGPAAMSLDPLSLLALGHGMAGGLVDLVVLYILIRMWFTKYLPARFKIKNFKLLMQVALYAWTFMVLAGLSLFTVSYIVPSFGSVTQTVPAPLPALSLTPTISPVNGSIGIRDDRRNSDAILITLQDVPPPPAGQTYVGWLIGGDGASRLNVGVLTVDAAGNITAEYVSPSGENLIERYDEFMITSEAGGVLPAQPSETIAFSAVAPSQARQQLRLLLANAPDTQGHRGYLIGLLDAGSRIEEHAKLAQEFGDRGSVGDARRQAEIIVNMIEGAGGKDFGDVDGDGRLLVDGDGVAFLPTKLDRVKQLAQAAIDAADASETIKLHAGHLIIGVDNARIWAEQLKARALLLARISDASVAKNLALDVYSLAKKLVHGVDMNNDGVISPTPGEGTLEVAYRSAQVAASPASQATLNIGGQPLTAAAVTPSPAPTGMPEPKPAPGEVIVKMKDMVFAPQVITVKAGTKITWVNEDNAPHTATADDNTWDTKTLTFGQSGSITFDKAGEFPYYCLFHGGPQGVGMAGNVIVTP